MARVDAGSVRLVVNFLGESLPLTSFFFCWNSSIFYLLQLVHHSHGGYNEAMMIGDDRFLIIKKKNAIVTFHLTRQLPTDTFTPTSFLLSDLMLRFGAPFTSCSTVFNLHRLLPGIQLLLARDGPAFLYANFTASLPRCHQESLILVIAHCSATGHTAPSPRSHVDTCLVAILLN